MTFGHNIISVDITAVLQLDINILPKKISGQGIAKGNKQWSKESNWARHSRNFERSQALEHVSIMLYVCTMH